jgi:hypothetical protein
MIIILYIYYNKIMIDIKYYNIIKKVEKFKNDNQNYLRPETTEDIFKAQQEFCNECNIDMQTLNYYLLNLYSSYLYFSEDKYSSKKIKVNKYVKENVMTSKIEY